MRGTVKPMHFTKGTSCFSLKWDNDWSGLEEVISEPGWNRLFLASGKFYVLWKGCMLSRFTVMMCVSIAVVGGKLRFLSGRPCDVRHRIFHRNFAFWAQTIVIFSTIATVWEFGRGFCSWG